MLHAKIFQDYIRRFAEYKAVTKHRYFYQVLLAIVTFIVFFQVIGHQFVWYDDDVCVYENPYMKSFTATNLLHFWKNPLETSYTPLPVTIWAIEAAFAKTTSPDSNKIEFNPSVFHATNLIFHIVNVLLVFIILRILIKDEAACFFGALLFSIHPLQVEPVAWVTGLKDVLSGFFSLIAIWQYLLYAKLSMSLDGNNAGRDYDNDNHDKKKWKAVYYSVAVLSFILAMLAKPTRVIVPIAAFALDYFILQRKLRDIALSLIGWVAIALPVMVLAIYIMRIPDGAQPGMSIIERLLVPSDSLVFYLYKLILPVSLGPDYGRTPESVLSQTLIYFAWIIPAALFIVIYKLKKHRSWLFASAGIFIAGVFPVLGFIRFQHQEISTVADRYLYLSMLGPGIVLAFFLSGDILPLNRKRLIKGLCGVLLGVLGILSIIQTGYWENSKTFFEHAIRVNPDSSAFHCNLGIVLAQQGSYDEAIAHFSEALKRHPNPAGIQVNIGHALAQQGKYDEAIKHFSEALKSHSNPASVYANMGRVLAQQGKYDESVVHFSEALRLSPDNAEARTDLGNVLARRGKLDEAVTRYSEALRSDPNYAAAHLHLGFALAQQGKYNEAVFHYSEALRLSPKNAWAHNNLGIALAQQGKLGEAIVHFAEALKIDPGYQDAYRNLMRAKSLKKQ